MLKYFGREDTTLTVYTTKDCNNRCNFCSSKKLYEDIEPNVVSICENLKESINTGKIKNIVLTGGEPFNAGTDLLLILGILTSLKYRYDFKVYINTTMPKCKSSFIYNVFGSGLSVIDGISISRHGLDDNCFKEDVFSKSEILDFCNTFNVSTRINSVIDSSYVEKDIVNIINRWEGLPLNLRENYNTESLDTLHILTYEQQERYGWLNPKYVSGCYACATFKTNHKEVNIHKGLANTSHVFNIGKNRCLEVVDLVMSPNGKIYADWDMLRELETIEDVVLYEDFISCFVEKRKVISAFRPQPFSYMPHYQNDSSVYEHFCGGGGCGSGVGCRVGCGVGCGS